MSNRIPEVNSEGKQQKQQKLPPNPKPFKDKIDAVERIDELSGQGQELPQSRKFWSSVDLPDEEPKDPNLVEKTHSEGDLKTKAAEQKRKKPLTEEAALPTPFDLMQQPLSKDAKGMKGVNASGAKDKLEAQTAANRIPEDKTSPLLKPKHKEAHPSHRKTMKEPRQSHLWEAETSGDESRRDSKKSAREEAQLSPIRLPDPLPLPIQQASNAVLSAVSPYLSQEVTELFKHMVGGILFMGSTTPGITQTEVLLNSQSFQQSIFYNATILIEQYSTAPDSYNIRFFGSTAAVKAFQENLGSLNDAFLSAREQGKIDFRIGRMEASYTKDRPLFHRKPKSGEKDSDSEMEQG